MRKVFVLFVCSVCVYMAAGCARSVYVKTYKGEQQLEDQVARVYIAGGVAVKRFDSQEPFIIKPGSLNKAWTHPDVLEVLPGHHSMTVSFDSGGLTLFQRKTKLTLDAKAGHSYVVGAIVYVTSTGAKKGWRAMIVDKGKGYHGEVSDRPMYKQLKK